MSLTSVADIGTQVLEVFGDGKSLAVVANGALMGVSTGLFLRSFDSIVKAVASALEIQITAVLSMFLFGHAIDIFGGVSVALVSLGIYIYARNPVSAASPSPDGKKAQ